MECKPPAKGRPKGKTQTASARKKQKKASLERKKERTIDIGVLKGEWTQLKTKLNLNSDEELAAVLLRKFAETATEQRPPMKRR